MISLAHMLRKTPRNIQKNALQVSGKVIMAHYLNDEKNMRMAEVTTLSKGKPWDSGKYHKVQFRFHGKHKNPLNARAWVSCDCPWFLYVCEVAIAKKDSTDIIHSNGARPKKTNKKMKPQICKHIVKAMSLIQKAKFEDHSSMPANQMETLHNMFPIMPI